MAREPVNTDRQQLRYIKKKNPTIPFLESSTKTDSDSKIHMSAPCQPRGWPHSRVHNLGLPVAPALQNSAGLSCPRVPCWARRRELCGEGVCGEGFAERGAAHSRSLPRQTAGATGAGLCAFEALPLECSALSLGGWWV